MPVALQARARLLFVLAIFFWGIVRRCTIRNDFAWVDGWFRDTRDAVGADGTARAQSPVTANV